MCVIVLDLSLRGKKDKCFVVVDYKCLWCLRFDLIFDLSNL